MWHFLPHNYIYDGLTGRLLKLDTTVFEGVRNAIEKYQSTASEIAISELGTYAKTRHENADPVLSHGVTKLRHIVIVLTEQCNLACSYCPYPADPSRTHHVGGKHFSTEELDRILEFLRKEVKPFTTLSFYGGEPLFQFRHLRRVIENLRSERPDWTARFSLTSNLTVYTDEIGRFLDDSGAVMLVSIDGPKTVHDANRVMFNGQSSHERALRNLRRIRAKHPDFYKKRLGINAVISSTDFDEIDGFFKDYLSDVGLIRFSVVQPTQFNGVKKSGVADVKMALESWCAARLQALCDLEEVRQSPLLRDFMRKTFTPVLSRANVADGRKRFTSCQPGEKLVINSDLTFGVCEKTERLSQGSVLSGFSGSDDAAERFAKMLQDRCRKCFAAPMCSVCYATIWDGTDLCRKKLDDYCTDFRGRTARTLGLYVELRERFPDFDARISAVLGEGLDNFSDIEEALNA
jgi:uncharacterized protein